MPTLQMIELSIIIVHYRTPDLLKRCLRSIYASTGDFHIEVIVVENSPKWDEQVELRNLFPTTKWIRTEYNLGFARANNLGLSHAQGRYFLLLNPDSEVGSNTFSSLIDTYIKAERSYSVGLVTCRIRSSIDGSLLVGSGRGYPDLSRILRQHPIWIRFFRSSFRTKSYDPERMHAQTHEVDFTSGAVLLGQCAKFSKPEYRLDEDFFLYWEDMEWCARIQDKGLRHFFSGETEILHVNAASTEAFSNRSVQLYVSEILYYFKRLSPVKFLLYTWIVRNALWWDCILAKSKEEKAILTQKQTVFSHYVRMIQKNYRRNVSSGYEYLRYDPEVFSK